MKALFKVDPGNSRSPNVRCEVQIPDGWRRVWRGVVVRGDRFLNVSRYHEGVVGWSDVNQDDLKLNCYRDAATLFPGTDPAGSAGRLSVRAV